MKKRKILTSFQTISQANDNSKITGEVKRKADSYLHVSSHNSTASRSCRRTKFQSSPTRKIEKTSNEKTYSFHHNSKQEEEKESHKKHDQETKTIEP